MTVLYSKYDYQRFAEDRQTKVNFPPFRRDYARVVHSDSFRKMQTKTQIFPSFENDFFRNRLTHSLEVSQIAKSIAISLNNKYSLNIDCDLIEVSSLCHDIGHPPFGHSGEYALNRKMITFGGFESNAQTIHLLTKTEKKSSLFQEHRSGLNLTFRALASVLKYDNIIPNKNNTNKVIKGYYQCDKATVDKIKEQVLKPYNKSYYQYKPFKTIECYIMDIADDIAYSTYDIEDAFKGGFIDPLYMASASDITINKIYNKVANEIKIEKKEIKTILKNIFNDFIDFSQDPIKVYQDSQNIKQDNYLRARFTSSLVNLCVNNIQVDIDNNCPPLSKVYLKDDVRKQVEILKAYMLFKVITSPSLNIIRYRGQEVILELFDILIKSQEFSSLLPEDIGNEFYTTEKQEYKARIISNYISNMTDKHIVELYSSLNSDNSDLIFRPFY